MTPEEKAREIAVQLVAIGNSPSEYVGQFEDIITGAIAAALREAVAEKDAEIDRLGWALVKAETRLQTARAALKGET